MDHSSQIAALMDALRHAQRESELAGEFNQNLHSLLAEKDNDIVYLQEKLETVEESRSEIAGNLWDTCCALEDAQKQLAATKEELETEILRTDQLYADYKVLYNENRALQSDKQAALDNAVAKCRRVAEETLEAREEKERDLLRLNENLERENLRQAGELTAAQARIKELEAELAAQRSAAPSSLTAAFALWARKRAWEAPFAEVKRDMGYLGYSDIELGESPAVNNAFASAALAAHYSKGRRAGPPDPGLVYASRMGTPEYAWKHEAWLRGRYHFHLRLLGRLPLEGDSAAEEKFIITADSARLEILREAVLHLPHLPTTPTTPIASALLSPEQRRRGERDAQLNALFLHGDSSVLKEYLLRWREVNKHLPDGILTQQ
jgi:hypothetical protein